MSDPVLIALIGNMTAIIVSIIVSLSNGRKLNAVHRSTNGLKDQLVASTRREAFKDGVQHQKDIDEPKI